jgi:hypothetical protein
MKFYKDNSNNNFYWNKIENNKLNAIYYFRCFTRFFNNGKIHNIKNAAYVESFNLKVFRLNGITYGNAKKFTKQSWRKFVKLQAFL